MQNPDIIYEDNHILALCKPAGVSVHGDGRTEGHTVADWILDHYPELKNIGEPLKIQNAEFRMQNPIPRPGIVHRLDKETSGVLLITKNQESHIFVKKQFQDRLVEKKYYAIVYGTPKKKEGDIDAGIARHTKDFRKKVITEEKHRGEARGALTKYKALAESNGYSFLQVMPKTGRTHQIRVHLKSIGHPVVCDRLYASARTCPKEIGRLALHASSITFTHPNGSFMCIEAPLPADIACFVQREFSELRDVL
jgi:23S rRNA pseudouridine1911/1915/1917 synthase